MKRTHTSAAIAIGLIVVAFVSVRAPATEPFARIDAPVGKGWTPGERWKTETLADRQACRLTADVAYPRAKVLKQLPTSGVVMIKVDYHASAAGESFAIGLGAWGSPTKTIVAGKAGWQVGKVAFPAGALQRDLKDGTVGMLTSRKSKAGPAIGRIDLYVPTPTEVMDSYRQYVRRATDASWAASKTSAFKHVDDYDDDEPLAPSTADTKRGAIPFVRSYLKYVYPASAPVAAERVTQGRIRLTPGEYEPFQLAIKATKDFPLARAHFVRELPKGLTGELCWVESVPIRTKGGSRSKNWHVQPHRLWPKEVFPSCAVRKGDAQAWWVILKAAADAKPGVHEARIALANGSNRIATFDLQVEVLPFALPKDIGKLFLLCESRTVHDEALLADLAAHGCNGLNAFNSVRPVIGGKADFTEWDAYFARLKKHGLNRGFFWYLGNPRSGNSVMKSIGKAQFIQVLRGLNQRVVDGRYPKLFAISIDEAVTNGKAFKEFQELSALLREHAPALKCQGTSLDKHSYARRYKGLIDVLACNGSFAANSKWCRENGIIFSMYGYVAARVSANSTRALYGFTSYQNQAGGTNGWALRWYNGNPFNELDAGVSDWGILLPNWTGKPISTPAWEGYREGVDDQRYLAVLEKLIKDGKASDALVKEIREKGVGEMNVWAEKVVGDSVFGVALKNATSLEIARQRVIEEILKAMKK